MKHSMEHMRMHAIGDDQLDAVAGGITFPSFCCDKCMQTFFSRENKMYTLPPMYDRLCESCYNEEAAAGHTTDMVF